MTARKGLIVVNGIDIHTAKKFLWQVKSLVVFTDTSWCDTDTNDGGNNGPGELILVHPDGRRIMIANHKDRLEKKDDLASARWRRSHAGERGPHDTH